MPCAICGDECTEKRKATIRVEIYEDMGKTDEADTEICEYCLDWLGDLFEGTTRLAQAIEEPPTAD